MTSPSPLPLKEHQRLDVEWIQRVNRGLLGNEPGTGKTRSAITAFDGGHNLVIAPSLVIRGGTWADELEKWSAYPERWTVVPYSMLNAREEYINANGIRGTKPARIGKKLDRFVTNPEYLRGWDAVIVDEAHYTKGRKTSWATATNQIAKGAGSLLEMTGTPMPNWAHELFMILQAIFPEKAVPGKELGSYWRWVEDWFMTSPNRHNAKATDVGDLAACRLSCMNRPPWDPCEHYKTFADENLGEHFRRVLRDECLDLPPLTRQIVSTDMDTLQARMYRQMKKDYVTTVDGKEIVAWNQGAKNVALDKITTSPWCLNPQGPAKGGKFETLRYDLESRSRPTLVLAHYQVSVEGCASVAEQMGASVAYVHGGVPKRKQAEAVDRFKKGKLDVLVGSLETLAEGLTLTRADMAIFVESSYKPSRNVQATYRIHRMGQEHPCTIRDYRTPKSVDTRKHELLEVKSDRQMRVLTAAQFAALL